MFWWKLGFGGFDIVIKFYVWKMDFNYDFILLKMWEMRGKLILLLYVILK